MRMKKIPEKRKVMITIATISPNTQSVVSPVRSKTLYDTDVPEVWDIIMKALVKACEK